MSSSSYYSPRIVDPSEFIPLTEWHYPLSPAQVPAEVLAAIRPLPKKSAEAIATLLSRCQLEADHRAIQPGDLDVFSLPGMYRIAGTFSASLSTAKLDVQEWLRQHLFSHPDAAADLWCVSASHHEAFCAPPEVFINHWECLCGISREAAEIYPPDGSWIVLWETDYRRFVLYRRNPDNQPT